MNILYQEFINQENIKQRIYLTTSFCPCMNKEQYFFKIYCLKNGLLENQGYIYFYLDKDKKTSDFIGTYVKKEFRNQKIASLLVATWIDYCLNNNYQFLGTNKSQRKPFLLYLLKTYGFEILDKSIYLKSPNVIDICKDNKTNLKYLRFKNENQEQTFMNGKIAKEDNYVAIRKLEPSMSYLDSVILSHNYQLENIYKASEKTSLVLKRK